MSGGGVAGTGGLTGGGWGPGAGVGGLLGAGPGWGPNPLVAPVNCPEPSGGSSDPGRSAAVPAPTLAAAGRNAAAADFVRSGRGKAVALFRASRCAPVRLNADRNFAGSFFSACRTPVSCAARRTSSATRSNAIRARSGRSGERVWEPLSQDS